MSVRMGKRERRAARAYYAMRAAIDAKVPEVERCADNVRTMYRDGQLDVFIHPKPLAWHYNGRTAYRIRRGK